jgi:hypothetical protein
MAAIRGGKKRSYKVKGRLSCRKQYQAYCRDKYRSGQCASAHGGWQSVDSLKDSTIQAGYKAMVAKL